MAKFIMHCYDSLSESQLQQYLQFKRIPDIFLYSYTNTNTVALINTDYLKYALCVTLYTVNMRQHAIKNKG